VNKNFKIPITCIRKFDLLQAMPNLNVTLAEIDGRNPKQPTRMRQPKLRKGLEHGSFFP
jgi:hypothetical protein